VHDAEGTPQKKEVAGREVFPMKKKTRPCMKKRKKRVLKISADEASGGKETHIPKRTEGAHSTEGSQWTGAEPGGEERIQRNATHKGAKGNAEFSIGSRVGRKKRKKKK